MKEVFSIGLPALGTTFVSCMGYIVFAAMDPPQNGRDCDEKENSKRNNNEND